MFRNKSALFTCVFVASIALSPATGSASPDGAAPTGVTVASVTIDNFAKVNDTYFRGAQPADGDYATLAGLGVKTVIDLQGDGENFTEGDLVQAAGMTFHRIPMTTRTPPTSEQLALFLKIVNDPANQPVYVHCAGGRHRTGVMTAVYRMTRDGLTPDQAFKEMKRYKYGPDFLHPEFKRFVYGYSVERQAVQLPAAASALPATN